MTNYETYLAAPDKQYFLQCKKGDLGTMYDLYFAGLVSECGVLRREAYPSFADQFDMLYHSGFEAWKASIEAVKTRYPKPAPIGGSQ